MSVNAQSELYFEFAQRPSSVFLTLENGTTYEVSVDENNQGSTYLEIKEPKFGTIVINQSEKYPIYLEYGQKLNLRQDYNKKMLVSGQKSQNAKAWMLAFDSIGGMNKSSFNESGFECNYYANAKNEMLNPINNMGGHTFKKKALKKLNYQIAATQLLNNYGTHQYNSLLNISNEELINNAENYRDFVLAYANRLSNGGSYETAFEIVSQKMQGSVRSFTQKELIKSVYKTISDDAFMEQALSTFIKQNTVGAFNEEMMGKFGGYLVGMEGLPAPYLGYLNENNQPESLSQLRGKVVYISFWASWCKPCIAGFEKSKALREELNRMGVVLLNINIDQTENLWRSSLEKHQPLGKNVWVNDLAELYKNYQISSIPRYHIVAKNGTFANLPDHKGRNIVEEFRKLVNN